MSDWGHAMFAEDRDSVCDCYGENEYLYDGSNSTNIEDLKDAIISTWKEDAEMGLLPIGYDDVSAEDIYDCFNPDDIVASAGAWDDGDVLTWFWERVGERMDISAIITNDGAIVFDRDLIKAA